jgi:DNA polymerase-1
MADTLFLLDGMALVYRAHFALIRSPIMTTGGLNTSAVFGFANTLLSILEKEKPTHLAVAFDTGEPTERHEKFEAYKAQREEMPEDIAAALPYINQLIEAFGIPILAVPGFEADDVIGTVAHWAEEKKLQTYMVTPDKDFAQLVSDRTAIYKPAHLGGGFDVLGVPEILEKWGVERIEQVIDVLALWGDAVDNIPGIPGIGEKTAKKLVAQFGSVEKLIESTDQLKGKQKENVENFADQGLLSKELVTINCEVPLEVSLEELTLSERDDEALKSLFVELEFNSLGQRLFGEGFKAGRGKAAAVSSEGDVEEQGELFGGTLNSIEDVKHDYRKVEGKKEIAALVKTLSSLKAFCFDTETTSLNPAAAELIGVALSWEPHEAVYVPVPADPAEAAAILDAFRPVLENETILKIGHNLKYDLKVLAWNGVQVAGPFFDTMVAHALVEPDQRHTMDFLAEACLGYSPVSITRLIGEKKEEQLSMRDVPVDTVVDYAAEDADITLQLKQVLEPRLKEVNAEKVFYDIEIRLMPVLAAMEVTGIALDTAALKEFSETLETSIVTLRAQIYQEAGREFNLNSPKQLGEILFDELHVEEKPKKTKTGQYQTNEQVLTRLAVRFDIARHILEYREATKLKSTYVDALPGHVQERSGRIHTTYAQVATATGRLASNGPNLQNIPIRSAQGQEIRKAFIPRDGDHLLVSADYSQIELRIMAELSGDPAMLEAFQAGHDIHASTAAHVHGVSLAEVTPDMRRVAKMVNFGLMYGMSVFGLSQRLGIPRKEAAEIVDAYFGEFPSIKKYMERTIAFAAEHGYVETMAGRRRYLRDITSRNQTTRSGVERLAVNSPIQGSGADMIKLAMVRIHDAFRETGLKSRMILQVHDELVFDAVKSEVDPVKEIVTDCMVHALPMKVPIVVDIGVGENWLEAH